MASSMRMLKAAEIFTGQFLPVLSAARGPMLERLCGSLNGLLDKERQSAAGVEMVWKPCSFCPKDAVSLCYREKGKDTWEEVPGLVLFWDSNTDNISTISPTPTFADRDTAFPLVEKKVTKT